MSGLRSVAFTGLVFALGALTGALGMRLALQSADTPKAAAPTPVVDEPAPLAEPDGSGLVQVTLSNGDIDVRGHGIALSGDNLIVVSLDGFRPATRSTWRGVDGRVKPLNRAVAWDFDLGIAVFDGGEIDRDGLSLSDEDGSLYLGREFALLGAGGRVDGFVDSAASAMPDGSYRYRIALDRPALQRSAGLLLPNSRSLIGLALTPGATPRADGDAVDAETLRDLIATRSDRSALSVADLSTAYLGSYPGLRMQIGVSVNAGRWEQAVASADRLLNEHPARIGDDDRELVTAAYLGRTSAFLEAGDFNAAVDSALIARDRVGDGALLRLYLARGIAGAGDRPGGVRTLLEFLEAPAIATTGEQLDALTSETRSRLLALVNENLLSANDSIAILRRALRVDDFAGYHRDLGQLLYQLGYYADAEASLRRAIELEPGYAAELEYALAESRQRRSAAQLIEVPFRAVDNAIFVNVRLNGSGELYRFLLDTGATYSAISRRTMNRLGLDDQVARSGALLQLETANGVVSAPRINVGTIDLSGAVVQEVPAVVLDGLGDLDGLLGLSFLRHFDVEINQRDARLLLTPR